MTRTRKERASVHAGRSWTCPCGRTVYGNGGKASHTRACVPYRRARLSGYEKTLAEIDAGKWGAGRIAPRVIERYRHLYATRAAALRESLAGHEEASGE